MLYFENDGKTRIDLKARIEKAERIERKTGNPYPVVFKGEIVEIKLPGRFKVDACRPHCKSSS